MAEPSPGGGAEPSSPAPAEPAPDKAPAEKAPAESAPAGDKGDSAPEQQPADQQSAEKQPAEDKPAEQQPADEKPAESTEKQPEKTPGGQKTDESQENDGEFGARVRAESPLPDSDTEGMRAIARDLRTTGTRGQEAVDEATRVTKDTGENFRGQPGEELGSRLAAETENARKTGEDMTKLADDVDHAANTVDTVTQQRKDDIAQGGPIYELAGLSDPIEAGATQDRMVHDAVNRGQQVTQQGAQNMQGIGDWFTGQTEQGPVTTPSKVEIKTKVPDSENKLPAYRRPGDEASHQGKEQMHKGWGLGGKAEDPTRPGVARKGDHYTPLRSKNYISPAIGGSTAVTRDYSSVADAVGKVDTGLQNLELAGKDVPVQFKGSASGWASTGLPTDSLYSESGGTATEKGARFDEKRAWGAGGTAAGRLDVGAVTASLGADAMAGAEVKGRLDLGATGKYVGAEAGGFAGARAGLSGSADIGGIGAGAKAEVRAGLGAEAGFSIGQKDGKWVIGGKAGLTLGVGAKVEGSIVIDPAKVGQTLSDTGKAFGDWVGGMFGGQSAPAGLPAGAI
ncbi:hypothetical protein GCM10027445_64640 [Amycolatopsis endophytica]|uniref:Outer membrane channel protein CpnT-like N-terminal domain-containing protein n=1 Tax=Amycolatopsis endophytica TaxID=860233 RepID=A0A853B4W9_9PSEU|nr:hypothetical protein [Amycolatopsis endophytica]NYI89852.1 hypothetical protein [Amycolatopsis endophytica]